MTTLSQGKTITRRTKASVQHKPLVVTLCAEFLEIRQLGSRQRFNVAYETIFRDAAQRQAERDRRDRLIQQRAQRR